MSKIIGLTGPIACGKTTATNYLRKKYSAQIIDADLISRQISSQPEIIKQIIAQFGEDFFDPQTQQINRSQLADLIFSQPTPKTQLEKILHPPIIKKIKNQLTQLVDQNHPLIIISAPLLVETNLHLLADQVWTVETSPLVQTQRLKIRSPHLSDRQIQFLINSQNSPLFRAQYADQIIKNNSTLKSLFQAVENLLSSLE